MSSEDATLLLHMHESADHNAADSQNVSEPLAVLDVKTVEEELQSTKEMQGSDDNQPEETTKKRGRGRPKTPKSLDSLMGKGDEETPSKRGRGRPKKIEESPSEGGDEEEDQQEVTPKKRGRGRPKSAKKTKRAEEDDDQEEPPKRGRGRPKSSKKPVREQSASSMEGGEDDENQEEDTPKKRGRGRPASPKKGRSPKRKPIRTFVYDDKSDSEESRGSIYRPAAHHAHKSKKEEKRARGRPGKASLGKASPARSPKKNYNEKSDTGESEEESEEDSSQEAAPVRGSIAKKKGGTPRKNEKHKGKSSKKDGRGRHLIGRRKNEERTDGREEVYIEYDESSTEKESSGESDPGDRSFGASAKKRRKDGEYCPETYYDRCLANWKKSPKKIGRGTPKKNEGSKGCGTPKKSEPKGRGRPKKKSVVSDESDDASPDREPAVKRKRGRPKKDKGPSDGSPQSKPGDEKKKRGRGRPRKEVEPVEEAAEEAVEEAAAVSGEESESKSPQAEAAEETSTPRQRGRPKGSMKRKRGRLGKGKQAADLEESLVEGGDVDEDDVKDTPTKRGRGRPKKSEASPSSKDVSMEVEDEDENQEQVIPKKSAEGDLSSSDSMSPKEAGRDGERINGNTTIDETRKPQAAGYNTEFPI